jgi:2-hydroxychromene-2-carboxylate isomerase
MSRRAPRVYFSFRSPYSWLACRNLAENRPELRPDLDWRPFWEPDMNSERLLNEQGGRFLYTPMSREKHLYLLGDVRRLARRRGLTMTWPLDDDPCWEVPHLAYFAAWDAGRGLAFVDRVYRARWQEGRDICDRETIAGLAEDVGVCGVSAAGACDRADMRLRGVEALRMLERDGVFGVPFFVNGTQRFWGIDRLSDFLETFESDVRPTRVDAEIASAPVPTAGDLRSTDWGHAGGCG